MALVCKDLFGCKIDRPEPIFIHVKAVWILDGCDTSYISELQNKVAEHRGCNQEDLYSPETTHIVATDWAAVVMRWSWRWINWVMTEWEVVVVEPEWIQAILDNPGLSVSPEDYKINLPWESTIALIQEKISTDRQYKLPYPEFFPFKEDPYEAASQRAIVDEMEKSLFVDVKVIFVEKGISKWALEQYRRNIVEHQGELVDSLTKKTTHLVTQNYTDACVQFGVTWIRLMSANHGLHVVNTGWLDESLQLDRLVRESCYSEFEMAPTFYTP